MELDRAHAAIEGVRVAVRALIPQIRPQRRLGASSVADGVEACVDVARSIAEIQNRHGVFSGHPLPPEVRALLTLTDEVARAWAAIQTDRISAPDPLGDG